MNNILCIADTILDIDIYDIDTIDTPLHTLIRSWEDRNGELIRMEIQRVQLNIERDINNRVVRLIVPNTYFESKESFSP